MNNLSGLRCYFAHPIENHKSDDYIGEQKNTLKTFLKSRGSVFIDPKNISFHGISELLDKDEIIQEHGYEELRRQMKAIVRKDLRSVDVSDFVVGYLPKDIKTTGTIHEIIQSDNQKKPTLLVCPDGIDNLPAWFFGIIPIEYMFNSIENLIDYLNEIDKADIEEIEDDRWQFIMNCLQFHKKQESY